jgi:hypothetical protein
MHYLIFIVRALDHRPEVNQDRAGQRLPKLEIYKVCLV